MWLPRTSRQKTQRFFVHFFPLLIFLGLAVYLRIKALDATILEERIVNAIQPLLSSNIYEIIFGPFSSYIRPWRDIFLLPLFQNYGFSETSWRLFDLIISLLLLIAVFRMVSKELGYMEACLALFLLGISHFSISQVLHPGYAGFYLLASFFSFYYLWKGMSENKITQWWGFGVWNFLNISNVIIAGMIVLPIMMVGGYLIVYQFKSVGEKEKNIRSLKRKGKRFFVAFVGSLSVALTYYEIRGLNLPSSIFNLFFFKTNLDNIAVGRVWLESSRWDALIDLLIRTFIKFNFQYLDSYQTVVETTLSHWAYLAFFLVGLVATKKKNEKLFGFISIIVATSVLECALGLGSAAPRYISFLLPFYLIVVSCGVVYLLDKLIWFVSNAATKNALIYCQAFFIFGWWVQPDFNFVIDNLKDDLKMNGFPLIKDYIVRHIRPGEILLNATNQINLGNPGFFEVERFRYEKFYRNFFAGHRLGLLAHCQRETGIWVVWDKKLEDNDFYPFFFPKTYNPSLIMTTESHGHSQRKWYLYYGAVDCPSSGEFERNHIFNTPFWSFIKATEAQKIEKREQAAAYYKKMISFGYNIDRAYFNLSLLYFNEDWKKTVQLLEKVISILEAPTIPPVGSSIIEGSVLDPRNYWYPVKRSKQRLRFYLYKNRDGFILKKYFYEDVPINFSVVVSKYYLLLAKLQYYLFAKGFGEPNYKKSMVNFNKSLKLSRTKNTEALYLFLKMTKNKDFSFNVHSAQQIIGLNFTFEEFPPLKKDLN